MRFNKFKIFLILTIFLTRYNITFADYAKNSEQSWIELSRINLPTIEKEKEIPINMIESWIYQAKLNMPEAKFHKTPEQIDQEAHENILIEKWITFEKLNEYGDPIDTLYDKEKAPLDWEKWDRYEYIKKKHPRKPWLKYFQKTYKPK